MEGSKSIVMAAEELQAQGPAVSQQLWSSCLSRDVRCICSSIHLALSCPTSMLRVCGCTVQARVPGCDLNCSVLAPCTWGTTTVRSPALNTRASPGTQGGKEAARSNAILHRIIVEAVAEVAPSVGRDLISLVTTRQGVDDLLKLDDVIDLVRPVASSVPNRGGWHMLVLACWPGCAR